MNINNAEVKDMFKLGAAMGVAGFIGGEAVRLFIPSVSAVGYGLTLGLWPVASAGIFLLAEKVNRRGSAANLAIALVGGYFASLFATKLMGFSVAALAPFLGLAGFMGVAVVVGTVAWSCLICATCCKEASKGC